MWDFCSCAEFPGTFFRLPASANNIPHIPQSLEIDVGYVGYVG